MIRVIEGNILNAKEDIICHQVNCKGVMGSGLAKQIRSKYPEVYEDYKIFCASIFKKYKTYDDEILLGRLHISLCDDSKKVANLFAQYDYGRTKVQTDYNALTKALNYLYTYAVTYNKTIAIPYNLGCGLAGGDWDVVYGIIEEVFHEYDVTIYKLV